MIHDILRESNFLDIMQETIRYYFDAEGVHRIPYMAPILVVPEKAAGESTDGYLVAYGCSVYE